MRHSDDLNAESTIKEVAIRAYHEAIADPTYHGVDRNKALNVISGWCRNYDETLFTDISSEFENIVEEKRA